jgi:dTDP-4-amino-4,6-dideoxygalactose transaminase
LPMHPYLQDDQIKMIAGAINNFVSQAEEKCLGNV